MIPIDKLTLPVLVPLIQARIDESQLGNRVSAERAIKHTFGLIDTGTGAAFVDDLENPTVAIILQTVSTGLVFEEKSCNIILIYVPKEHRTLQKALTAVKQIETYAREQQCTVIYGSSWLYKGVDQGGIGALWKHAGFEEQELVYVKHL